MTALLLLLQMTTAQWAAWPYMDRYAWAVYCDSLDRKRGFRACMASYPATAWPWAQTPVMKRTYWRVTVDQLAQGVVKHTHVQVSGRVKLVRHEQDGDLHIQLTGVKGFIVAECIPRMPCDPPAVGSLVTVRGLSRFDGEHHWWEVHPVEQIAAGVVR